MSALPQICALCWPQPQHSQRVLPYQRFDRAESHLWLPRCSGHQWPQPRIHLAQEDGRQPDLPHSRSGESLHPCPSRVSGSVLAGSALLGLMCGGPVIVQAAAKAAHCAQQGCLLCRLADSQGEHLGLLRALLHAGPSLSGSFIHPGDAELSGHCWGHVHSTEVINQSWQGVPSGQSS